MKKILAMMLTAAMMLSMSAAVMAEGDSQLETTTPTYNDDYNNGYDEKGNEINSESPVYTDVVSLDVAKTYTVENNNSVNPKEDFTFTITRETYSDSAYATLEDVPLPYFKGEDDVAVYTGTISYEEGEATVAGDTNTVRLYLPKYDHVGIYTYKIVENPGKNAGVDYDTKPLFLKVTVIEQDGETRVVALHYETETGNKDESFKNHYSAGDLTIEKDVTGSLGDLDKYFTFKVTLSGDTTKTYEALDVVTNSANENNPETVTVGTEATFYLKNGDKLTIKNIPYDVTYTVEEVEAGKDGYTTTYTEDLNKNEEGKVIEEEGVIDDALDTIHYLNDKDPGVDTGISVDSIPYIAMLGVVAVGGAGVVVSKKRRSED